MPFSSESDSALNSKNEKRLTFYEVLGVSPQSTQSQIRDAYRRKSKLYHPDTTSIEKSIAAQKFQVVNQAYDTLRFPEKRQAYDSQLKRVKVVATRRPASKVTAASIRTQSAFLEPEDRPLSPGEIFALFILGVTFLFCLLVALFLGISRGEMLVNSMPPEASVSQSLKGLLPHDDSKTMNESKHRSVEKHVDEKLTNKTWTKASQSYKSNASTNLPRKSETTKKQLSLFPAQPTH